MTTTNQGLSKNLMKMKFMQRQADQNVQNQLDQEQQEALKLQQWGESKKASVFADGNNHSVVVSEHTLGRRSFGNFNKSIERLEKKKKRARRKQQASKRTPAISSKQALEQLESTADVSAKKMASVVMTKKRRKRTRTPDQLLTDNIDKKKTKHR
mmetsp:Transcript_8997/g.13601  ORF Transcript_8997/g.13601 Transcript_8997/m.13601 type:complete len:155 (+) Transcript_8997:1535-1999(+)